ncbi:MAG: tetratricopeptide repeat protein [Bdellovibrionales bacterium]
MMKMPKLNRILALGMSGLLLTSPVHAENREPAAARTKRKSSTSSSNVPSSVARVDSELASALQLAKTGRYKEASMKLFQLSVSPRFRDKRMQIKYILGLMLYQMKLNQVAAFQFISVVKDGNNKFLKQSLEKLSLAADALGDDTLLNYAISRVQVDEFPRAHRDMLYYRIGEFQSRNGQFDQAAKSYSRVQRTSPFFPQAKYLEGLSYAELQSPGNAIVAFEDLINSRNEAGITDPSRVAGLMGKARSLYQKKEWDGAIETYREVPRDTPFWHDTLFESSWAMLRSGRFRSALSNFQSLHSAFYEDFYLPESLLLRSIVYLYICKYDEMEKVLNLFNRIYRPVYKSIEKTLNGGSGDSAALFNEAVKVMRDYKVQGDEMKKDGYKLPFLVVRKMAREGDFQSSYNYIRKLLEEKKRLDRLPAEWRSSAIGRYAKKVITTRLQKARKQAGQQIKAHLEAIREELFDLFEQEGFIRYEMINGRKESLKKRIAGKDMAENQIDEKLDREYSVQNGYEYWPFRGEYWLDELGNYHYVGTQSCE